MRKLCVLLTVLFMCLSIVACGKQENTGASSTVDTVNSSSTPFDEKFDDSSTLHNEVVDSSVHSSESTGTSSSTFNEASSFETTSGEGSNNVIVDPRPFGCYDGLANYETFMEKYTMPDGFVRYEDISEFGEIYSMYFVSNGYKGDYSIYEYWFIDKHGRGIGLCIYQNKDDYEPFIVGELTDEDINATDMQQTNYGKKGIYEIDGIKYQYSKSGKLYGISWTAAGIGYLLYGEYMPSSQETIVQKLLNLETAYDTLKEIFGEELGK